MNTTLRALAGLAVTLIHALTFGQGPVFEWSRSQTMSIGAGANGTPPFLITADPGGGTLTWGLQTWQRNYSADSYGSVQLMHYGPDGLQDGSHAMAGNVLVHQLEYGSDGSIYLLGQFLDSVQVDPWTTLYTDHWEPHIFFTRFSSLNTMAWTLDLNQAMTGANSPDGLAIDVQGNAYIGYEGGNGSFIQKYDINGTLLSTITQEGPRLFSIDVDEHGYVYAAGACAANDGALFGGVEFVANVSGNGYNRYLVRYSPSGIPTWVKFSGDFTCSDSEVKCRDAGGVYWAGSLIGEATFDTHVLTGPSNGGTPGFHLISVDSTGAYDWVMQGPIGQSIGVGVGMRSYLDVDDDGNAILAGSNKGDVTWPDGETTTAGAFYDPIMLCYGAEGGFQWMRKGSGGYTLDQFHSVAWSHAEQAIYGVGTTRGDLALGSTSTPSQGVSVVYPFVAKLAADASTGVGVDDGSASLVLFPDPVNELLFVRSASPIVRVECHDALGRRVDVQYAVQAVDVRDLTTGVYHLSVFDAKGTRSVRSFVKE